MKDEKNTEEQILNHGARKRRELNNCYSALSLSKAKWIIGRVAFLHRSRDRQDHEDSKTAAKDKEKFRDKEED